MRRGRSAPLPMGGGSAFTFVSSPSTLRRVQESPRGGELETASYSEPTEN